MILYKIVDTDGDKIKTLFHGLNGSRTIPRNQWLVARKAVVSDGTRGTQYVSGWHGFAKLAEAKHFLLKRFKRLDGKAIVRCRASGVRKKAHSHFDILLADRMLVERIVWRYQKD